MESNLDAIFEVALNTNFKTTIKLLESYPELLVNYNFWVLKCRKQFPNKPYFDMWTGEENYLVQSKGQFMVAVCLCHVNDYCLIDKYLYEYHKTLKHLYYLAPTGTQADRYYDLVKFNVSAQFVVINKLIEETDPSIIGQYNDEKDAIRAIENKCLRLHSEFCRSYRYCIINLQYMIPYFFKIGKLRKYNRQETKYMKFYRYIDDKLIEFK